MRLFRRRPAEPDAAAIVAARARELAAAAERVSAEAASLSAREHGIDEREVRLEERRAAGARELDERTEALTALGRDLAARERRAAALEGRLAAREQELREREARALAAEAAARRREDELRAAEHRLAARADERSTSASPPPASACVLFVPSASGYRLVPLERPPPQLGEQIDLAGETFVVLRVGRSPLPGDGRPCAFLAA